MKYVHIMNYSNFVVSKMYVQFISDYFDNKEHSFIFIGNFDSRYEQLSNVCKIIHLTRREDVIPYLKKAELVLLHALTFNAKMQMISMLNPSIMRKIVWIAWGGDLYKKEKRFNLKNLLTDFIKKTFIRRLRFFVSIFDPDAEYFSKNYKSKARIIKSCYVGSCYLELYRKNFEYVDLLDKFKNGKCINIMIGHQANPELNHIRVLNSLLPYKDKNIKIYIPLSYGDKKNALKTEEYAKELYGEKAVVLKEWMSIEEYDDILKQMDIAIFHTTRQIGLGNINKLMHMRKKIFIYHDSVMYKYYMANNAKVYDSATIGNITFFEFVSNERNDSGVKFIKEWLIDKDKRIEQWENIFAIADDFKDI